MPCAEDLTARSSCGVSGAASYAVTGALVRRVEHAVTVDVDTLTAQRTGSEPRSWSLDRDGPSRATLAVVVVLRPPLTVAKALLDAAD